MESRYGDDSPASRSKTMRHVSPTEPPSGNGKDGEPSGRERRASADGGPRRGGPYFSRQTSDDRPRFQIPRKNREKRALFQNVTTESREFEDILNILSSNYLEAASNGTFIYSNPRLIHSELLEKDFVEKRKELKLDGRTEKELEESHCFMLCDSAKLPWVCEKGVVVGQSWITVLGNPAKGVYLSKYSDLLQINPFNPGVSGEIIIFKIMKGKVKGIYENMTKNLLDPTPKFDSHVSKNASKVTSLTSYRAYELTQQYFYEYNFDELKPRPRQVCPFAVLSFQFKAKDAPLQTNSMAPLRANSQSEGTKERRSYAVWSGWLVNGEKTLCQASLRSYSPPFLPFQLPERLELGKVMTLDRVCQLIPSALFSRNLYAGSHEVVKNNMYGSLLEVVEKSRSGYSLDRLRYILETKKVVFVNTLPDQGFLILLSSVQMATPTESGLGSRKCIQALFIYQESRDVARHASKCPASQGPAPAAASHLDSLIPALHYALVKVCCNPPPDISAGVEQQAKEYLSGCKNGKVRPHPMAEYDSKLDDRGKLFPAPKHHKQNMEGYLRSYVYSPPLYLLAVAKARQMMAEAHRGRPNPGAERSDRPAAEGSANGALDGAHADPQKVQELINLALMCKRKAEKEVQGRREGGGGVKRSSEEQETAERTLKYLKKASMEREGSQSPSSAAGLKDVDLRGSTGAVKLLAMLTSLKNAAAVTDAGRPDAEAAAVEEPPAEASPLDHDTDSRTRLSGEEREPRRKRDYLEEQTAGSVSSLEGFSPSSHGEGSRGEGSRGPARSPAREDQGRGDQGRGDQGREDQGREDQDQAREEQVWQIPWVLIPITGLRTERYCQREKDNPQDPRFLQVTMATPSPAPSRPGSASPPWAPELSPPPQEQLGAVPGDSQRGDAQTSPSGPRVETVWLEEEEEEEEERREEPSPPSPPFPSASESSPPPERSRSPSPLPPEEESPMEEQQEQEEESLMEDQQEQEEGEEEESLMEVVQQQEEENPVDFQTQEDKEESPVEVEEEEEEEKEEESPVEVQDEEEDPVEVQEEEEKEENPVEVQEEEEEEKEESPVEVQDEEEENPVEVQPQEEEEEEQSTVGVQEEEENPVEVQPQEEEESLEEGELLEVESPLLPPPSSSSDLTPPPSAAAAPGGLDGIVDEHLGVLTSEIQHLLQAENIDYRPSLSPRPQHPAPPSLAPLSEYVTFYHTPLPLLGCATAFRDDLASILESQNVLESHRILVLGPAHRARTGTDSPDADTGTTTHYGDSATTTQHDRDFVPGPPSHVHLSLPGSSHFRLSAPGPPASQGRRGTCRSPVADPSRLYLPQPGSVVAAQGPDPDCRVPEPPESGPPSDDEPVSSVEEGEAAIPGLGGGGGFPGPEAPPPGGPDRDRDPTPEPIRPSISSLISQLRPEVFSNLEVIMKDVQRNAVQFYIHTVEEENQVHDDIKEYLQRMGNVELSPLNFLDRENNMDKLLIIIQNKDIATQIHKIPSLVSLKLLPSVVFAGVDSLDDVRNHTYDELFVSGGFIVSDEFVLNPDFITHERLQALLMFLEQQSSTESLWRWKVHCKTQKKLREQARFKRDARNILNVLTTYQKRQVVEFLPYHDCDMASRQTPDLDCLIQLQAHNVQHRHIIFLTERRFEMFPNYSGSGIVIANIDDFMHRFHNLVGFQDDRATADDNNPATAQDPEVAHALAPHADVPRPSSADHPSLTERPFLPYTDHQISPPSSQTQDFHLPLSRDQLVPSAETPASSLPSTSSEGATPTSEPDFEALRQAISQFKAEKARALAGLDPERHTPPERFDSAPPPRHHQSSRAEFVGPPNPTQQAVAATLTSLACLHSKLGMGGGSESDSDMSHCGSKDGGSTAAFGSPGPRGPLPPFLRASPLAFGSPPAAAANPEVVVERDTPDDDDIPDTPQSPEQCLSTGNPGPLGGGAELRGGGPKTGKEEQENPAHQGNAPPAPAAAHPAFAHAASYHHHGVAQQQGPSAALSRLAMQHNGLLPSPLVANLGLLHGHAPLPLPHPGALIRGLLPGNLPPNWPGLGQTVPPSVWGFQPRGLGQMLRPSLMGNYSAHGGRFRPQRGGFNGL